MARSVYPEQQADLLGSAMRGYSFVDDAIAARDARRAGAEDREWQRGRRARQANVVDPREDARYQYETDSQLPAELRRRVAEGQANASLAEAMDTPQRIAYQQGQRQYDETGRLTPEQLRERNATALAAQQAALRSTQDSLDTRQQDKAQETLRLQLAARLARLTPLRDPTFRRDLMALDDAASTGQVTPEVASRIVPAFATAYGDQIRQGIGEPIDGTQDVIVDKELDNLYDYGDHLVAGLRVKAKRPDGTTYQYTPPLTDGRSSAPDAPVTRIPKAEVTKQLGAMAKAARALDAGGAYDAEWDRQMREYIAAGGDVADIPGYGGTRTIFDPVVGTSSSAAATRDPTVLSEKDRQSQATERAKAMMTAWLQSDEARNATGDQLRAQQNAFLRDAYSQIDNGVPDDPDPWAPAAPAGKATGAATGRSFGAQTGLWGN